MLMGVPLLACLLMLPFRAVFDEFLGRKTQSHRKKTRWALLRVGGDTLQPPSPPLPLRHTYA